MGVRGKKNEWVRAYPGPGHAVVRGERPHQGQEKASLLPGLTL